MFSSSCWSSVFIVAIFYAINQRRDDVVRLLVECGANLLIVNRNGNTPCGLASRGQLLPETCELLEKKKLEQLQSGRTFQNYNTDPKLNGHCSCIRSEQVIQEESKATINEDESDDSASSLKRLSKMLRDAGMYHCGTVLNGASMRLLEQFLTSTMLGLKPERKTKWASFVL